MFKKLVFSILAAMTVIAAGGSAYSVQAAPATTLLTPTAEEKAGLLYMFEEEKLAHDVYDALYARWNHPIFQNIASSELVHMDAVRSLLLRYGVSVPANPAGVFNDPTLQALYNRLISSSSQSLEEALKAGKTIEETDISDLQSHLARTTNADIQRVYTNLLNGSSNHLRAFERVLAFPGGNTSPLIGIPAHQDLLARNGNGYRGGR